MNDSLNFKDSICIYELVEAKALVDQKNFLARKLFNFDLENNKDQKKIFSISPVSGWISFYDYNKIWNKEKPKLPNQNEVLTIVENYLKNRIELISKIGNSDNLKELYLQNYFQPPKKYLLTPVIHHSEKWIDHWLFQMTLELSSGILSKSNQDNWALPVFGGSFEFRIREKTKDDLGSIVGFNFKYRPYRIRRSAPFIPLLKDNSNQTKKENTSSPILVFILDGEGAPQNFLCPYFIHLTDDEGEITPASSASLCVDIIQEYLGSGKIRAVVRGGSGQYEYHWSRWSPDNVFDLMKNGKPSIAFKGDNDAPKSGEKGFGINGISNAEVPVGVHNVLLTVQDTKPVQGTQIKIIKQIQGTIYVTKGNLKLKESNNV